ncbi:MAG: hypothetical protein LBR26_07030 [Prevotella sp.]|nr:hypothetical protein [Prevotella sp.]
MFIKKIDKSDKKTGREYFTYRLCESYRIGDKVRHRNILNLGKLECIPRENFKLLCDRIEQKLQGLSLLFNDLPAGVEKAADTVYHQIAGGHLLDYAVSSPQRANIAASVSEQDIRPVDINSIENEDGTAALNGYAYYTLKWVIDMITGPFPSFPLPEAATLATRTTLASWATIGHHR